MNVEDEKKVIECVAKHLNLNLSRCKLSEVGGGYTGASKYVLDSGTEKLFLKIASSGLDLALVEGESKVYEFLTKINLTGILFPKYRCLIKEKGFVVLVIEYFENVTWGGPWTIDNIEKLDGGLSKLHDKKITEVEFNEIEKISGDILGLLDQELHPRKLSKDEIEQKNKPFFDAWKSEEGGFVDWKGEVYFPCDRSTTKAIVDETLKDIGEVDKVLVMHDLNFANICFSESQAHFVDPLYLKMGYADRDRVVVGINILQQLGDTVDKKIKSVVVERYITNKMALASLIKYYVTTTVKQMGANSEGFQKFHKECAVVALSLFRDWDEDRLGKIV